jgi:AcrR family transcriptional regulator
MEAAAKEFAAYGFERASLNRILAEADVSKGAAYYYFDDKADVFATTVQYYSQDILGDIADLAIEQLTTATFWPTLTQIYQQQLLYTFERPWAMGVFKAVGKVSPEILSANEPLATILAQIRGWLLTFLQHGQAIGIVRRDLPDDLLLGLFWTIDDVHDNWLLAHQAELTPDIIEQDILPRLIELFHRLLDPAEEELRIK